LNSAWRDIMPSKLRVASWDVSATKPSSCKPRDRDSDSNVSWESCGLSQGSTQRLNQTRCIYQPVAHLIMVYSAMSLYLLGRTESACLCTPVVAAAAARQVSEDPAPVYRPSPSSAAGVGQCVVAAVSTSAGRCCSTSRPCQLVIKTFVGCTVAYLWATAPCLYDGDNLTSSLRL
jgi:hypothetical protein